MSNLGHLWVFCLEINARTDYTMNEKFEQTARGELKLFLTLLILEASKRGWTDSPPPLDFFSLKSERLD